MRLVVRVHPIPPLLGLFHINRVRPTSFPGAQSTNGDAHKLDYLLKILIL